jgi:hypothetical protein
MKKQSNNSSFIKRAKRKRPSIHSKKKSSKLKSSKLYLKRYKGQG